MYLYLFDPFLGKPKYKKIIDKIETRITDLEISGRLVKLTILESVSEIVRDGLKRGVETIVIVGNDKTFCQAASALVDTNVSLGLIPVGENNKISEILGIPKEDLACEVVSSRLIETLDIGRVNNDFFISSVEIDSHHVILEDSEWQITPSSKINKIKIANLDSYLNKIANPKDGLLEVIIEKMPRKFLFLLSWSQEEVVDSLLFLKKIKINSPKYKKGLPVLVDGWRILKTPLEIEILAKKIKVIVGRKRRF